MVISLSQAIEPEGGYTTESVTHDQFDARPTVTFTATVHHRPIAGSRYQIILMVNRGTCV